MLGDEFRVYFPLGEDPVGPVSNETCNKLSTDDTLRPSPQLVKAAYLKANYTGKRLNDGTRIKYSFIRYEDNG